MYTQAASNVREFQSTWVDQSKNGRILKLKTDAQQKPKTGSIILVESGQDPILAGRVIRNQDDGSFIIRKIKEYQSTLLQPNQTYRTLERSGPVDEFNFDPGTAIAQSAPPTKVKTPDDEPIPSSTNQAIVTDEQNTSKVESTTQPTVDEFSDEDLDSIAEQTQKSKSTNQDKNETSENGTDEEEIEAAEEDFSEYEDSDSLFEYQERVSLFKERNELQLAPGVFRNMSSGLAGRQYSGLMLMYSRTLLARFLFRGNRVQDGFSLDFFAVNYSVLNATGNQDDYTLYPFGANARYSLRTTGNIFPYVYFGIQQNWLTSASKATRAGRAIVEGAQFNYGLGVHYNMGPQWYVRLNLGWDLLSVGLTLAW